jgi:Flp pilus assembly protein TadD
LAQAARGNYEKAIEALQLVISMNMDYLPAHCAIAGYYRRVGKDLLAQRHITHARPFMEKESEYNRACFEAICGNVEEAVKLLRTALETGQVPAAMLQTDADLDLIRDEPLFQEFMSDILQPVAAG